MSVLYPLARVALNTAAASLTFIRPVWPLEESDSSRRRRNIQCSLLSSVENDVASTFECHEAKLRCCC